MPVVLPQQELFIQYVWPKLLTVVVRGLLLCMMFQGNTHGSVLFSTMVPQTLTGDYEPPYNMKSTSASSTVESLKKKKRERERLGWTFKGHLTYSCVEKEESALLKPFVSSPILLWLKLKESNFRYSSFYLEVSWNISTFASICMVPCSLHNFVSLLFLLSYHLLNNCCPAICQTCEVFLSLFSYKWQ